MHPFVGSIHGALGALQFTLTTIKACPLFELPGGGYS